MPKPPFGKTGREVFSFLANNYLKGYLTAEEALLKELRSRRDTAQDVLSLSLFCELLKAIEYGRE